ncbi:MAG: ABC transporter ATP-binding protein [Methylobacteriaceae bacterium]|nr:ABC transporter ATP-binding protein [Methylobacteriaceae bacterium]
MILEARDLAIGYGERVVGRGFSLEARAGEVLALLGPNGGGKTTLLKTLLGLIPSLGGAVLLEGRPLDAFPVAERARRLAYVPQTQGGAFAFTVRDLVLMGRSAHAGLLAKPSARDREVARAAIARLGIEPLAERPITRISGGERQLALIARALAQEPRAIVLDEPTASLDLSNQGKVLRELAALAKAGIAVIVSTHDPNHALRFAHRCLLVRDGAGLASGSAEEVLTAETLSQLYGAPVRVVESGAERAFLPG